MLMSVNNPFSLGKIIYFAILTAITFGGVFCPEKANAQTRLPRKNLSCFRKKTVNSV